MQNISQKIAKALNLREIQVENTVTLLVDEECTIPFIARYRKERTGSLDEVQIRDIRDQHQYLTEMEKNREKYLKAVETLSLKDPALAAKWPALRAKFLACESKQELEDLYLPFKPKRRTRAQAAKEKGLEPLLRAILDLESAGQRSDSDMEAMATAYITASDPNVAPELKVQSAAEALQGAQDILAEEISENAEIRAKVRDMSFEQGFLVAVEADPESKDEEFVKLKQKYKNYFDYREPVNAAAPHRIMAVRRGEAEKALKMTIEVDEGGLVNEIKGMSLDPKMSDAVAQFAASAAEDGYKRLIAPSIETEIRLALKGKGEEEAIKVFAENLSNLLMLPPLPDMIVLGVDPGLRTGSKLAVTDETGKLLDYATVYPDYKRPDDGKTNSAKNTIVQMVKKHNVACIAVGNGTGSKEIDHLITRALKESGLSGIKRAVVSEAGASVYSTDPIAREEFPDLDPTIRSAVSIARRLQDPLAELVKVDPRSIGVGQYQHDVNITKLTKTLGEVVESCVNRVGVNVNTASYKLLSYVSGIGPSLAKNIVRKRETSGRFKARADLSDVTGFGPKAFQQAAGFLRIPGAEHPLDNSAVHPESYEIVAKIVADMAKPVSEVIGRPHELDDIDLASYVSDKVGLPTLQDIVAELKRPGRDPREDGARLLFSDEVSDISDLKVGTVLKGTVSNVTNFGAFVDIGVHQDGLVHLSELSEEYVQDASTVVQVGKVIDVRVIDVDLNRRRISLSMKQVKNYDPQSAARQTGGGDRRPGNDAGDGNRQRGPRQARPGQGQGQGQEGRHHDGRGPQPGNQRPGGNDGRRPPFNAQGNRRPDRPSPDQNHAQAAGRDDRHRHDRGNNQHRGGDNRPGQGRPPQGQQQRKPPAPSFTLDDLMKKFGKE